MTSSILLSWALYRPPIIVFVLHTNLVLGMLLLLGRLLSTPPFCPRPEDGWRLHPDLSPKMGATGTDSSRVSDHAVDGTRLDPATRCCIQLVEKGSVLDYYNTSLTIESLLVALIVEHEHIYHVFRGH